MSNYQLINTAKHDIKAWIKGVNFEESALQQLVNVANLPFIYKWICAMPDAHVGIGATVGSVIPTLGAIIPASVGVDIGCGMVAVKTSLKANDLPDDLAKIRSNIERKIPHGRSDGGGSRDLGSFHDIPPKHLERAQPLITPYEGIVIKHPKIASKKGLHNILKHLGTLGTGNHFIEICLDENNQVWIMLHSGSRGIGNKIGNYFIELAKQDMMSEIKNLPDKDLAYFKEGSSYFNDYIEAVSFAQDYAYLNRQIMLENVILAMQQSALPPFVIKDEVINCHHNYVAKEMHYGNYVYVTRKGAVKAGLDDMGIIPGSMGVASYIVKGKGNGESFNSCSHGAGRTMSRHAAKAKFTLEDHLKATLGVECRKDLEVIDETPLAYKPIENVMKAQEDLVDIVHKLKQVVCVKG